MTNKLGVLVLFGFICVLGLFFYFTEDPVEKAVIEPVYQDPKNTIYLIENNSIQLENGSFKGIVSPIGIGSVEVKIFGEPTYSDLDGDGDDDAVVLLTYNSAGSGTFYYTAIAISDGEKYVGGKALFVGDRIAPQNTEIRNGIILVNYSDRKNDEPMTTPPSVGKTLYAYVKDGQLVQVFLSGTNESVYFGNLVYGHEARIFTTCQGQEYWLIGTNEYLAHIQDVYEALTQGQAPYTPIFVVINGGIVDAPDDGFGADYDFGFSIKEIIKTSTTEVCK